MIVTQEKQRLYLGSWEYNAARILSKLAEIVEDNGGRVKPLNHAVIQNRNYSPEEREATEIVVTHTSYITFVLDGFYYYYQVDSNAFFPFYFTKRPIINEKYSRDAYLDNDPKEWFFDCFFSKSCCDADVVEAANLIFNMLCNAAPSQICRNRKRQRVPNTYNSGYHYETVFEPERFARIDF